LDFLLALYFFFLKKSARILWPEKNLLFFRQQLFFIITGILIPNVERHNISIEKTSEC